MKKLLMLIVATMAAMACDKRSSVGLSFSSAKGLVGQTKKVEINRPADGLETLKIKIPHPNELVDQELLPKFKDWLVMEINTWAKNGQDVLANSKVNNDHDGETRSSSEVVSKCEDQGHAKRNPQACELLKI